MSTSQQLNAVKRELSKLNGQTVYTIPTHQTNHIEKVCQRRGFYVKRKAEPTWVGWPEVLEKYSLLMDKGELRPDQSKRNNGAFCRAVFVTLSHVELKQHEGPPILRYRPDGLPLRLRARPTWPCVVRGHV